ncbi:MAG: hypothetical protein IK123_07605, partial [Lachnospiraceae bacterium]|nr:hypothetical protein [Lachnospiraceae bacterium]
GANGHHERYDGKGYPLGLKGSDIPEMARIIAVADAYDAMTSKRSYRDPIPQQIVREEIVKGVGTQFDPHYARLMLQLIDIDTGYKMRERLEVKELAGKNELDIGKHRSVISDGIYLSPTMTYITVKVHSTELFPGKQSAASMILFDSLDERVHEAEKEVRKLQYFEYGELWLDGRTTTVGARLIKTSVKETPTEGKANNKEYRIEAVRIRDHALVRIIGDGHTVENIIALPDSTRFAYIGLTGEQCHIDIESIDKADSECPANYIPRIADEISYIDVPDGDIPNVQVDGYRTDFSRSVVIKDGLKLVFHTQSLPTARLVWHCPFVLLFTSDDTKVNGKGYRELAFMRFDGEAWECDSDCAMERKISRGDGFEDWDSWKEYNKNGYDATVTYKVKGDRVTIATDNYGISISTTVIISGITKPIYTAITGDQVAITNIQIK